MRSAAFALFFALSVGSLGSAKAGQEPPKKVIYTARDEGSCFQALRRYDPEVDLFFKERELRVKDPQDPLSPIQFTKENIAYFKEQRNNLRENLSVLETEIGEGYEAIRGLTLARMGGLWGLMLSPFGAGKTLLANLIFSIPKKFPDGSWRIDNYNATLHEWFSENELTATVDHKKIASIQMDFQKRDAELRSEILSKTKYLDSLSQDRSKGKEFNEKLAEITGLFQELRGLEEEFRVEKRRAIYTFGSLVSKETAVLDEGDKTTPQLLQVLLGVILKHVGVGTETIEPATYAGVLIINKNLTQLLEFYASQLQDGKPALDRFPIKIYMTNWVQDLAEQKKVLAAIKKRLGGAAHLNLADVEREFSGARFSTDKASPLKPMDLRFLGKAFLYNGSWKTNAKFDQAFVEFENLLRHALQKQQKDSLEAYHSQGGAMNPSLEAPFIPTTHFSQRAFEFRQFLNVSVGLDLLRLPEEALSTEALIDLLQNQRLDMDDLSLARLAPLVHGFIPGSLQMEFTQGNWHPELVHGDLLEKHLDENLNYYDEGTRTTLKHRQIERQLFKETFDSYFKKIADFSKGTSNPLLFGAIFQKYQSEETAPQPEVSVEKILAFLQGKVSGGPKP